MSPELERLFEAFHATRTASDKEREQRVALFERLFAETLSRMPGLSRDEVLAALAERYSEFRRKRLKAERERLSRVR